MTREREEGGESECVRGRVRGRVSEADTPTLRVDRHAYDGIV